MSTTDSRKFYSVHSVYLILVNHSVILVNYSVYLSKLFCLSKQIILFVLKHLYAYSRADEDNDNVIESFS